jgi:hypothetical protein
MKLHKVLTALCLWVCFALPVLAVDSSPIEAQMRQLLQNKIIAFLVPYTADDLKFDVNSQLVGAADIGPWTLYGSIQISDVSLKDNIFQIDGERVALILPHGKTTLMPILAGRKIHVAIALTPPVDDNAVRGALGGVFSSSSVDEHFASYWKPSLDGVMDMDKPCKAVLKANPDGTVGVLASTAPVYACVKGSVVSKPKGVSTPEPGAGTKKPPQGSASLRLIVDEHGYPAIIHAMASSNGNYGMAALAAVSQWKYAPAMKDGKPVPYMLDVDLGKSAAAVAPDSDKDQD